jgi:hypothetical protein
VSRRRTHSITVERKNLFGSRMWWALCTCGKLLQGCHEKTDAVKYAAEHAKQVTGVNG